MASLSLISLPSERVVVRPPAVAKSARDGLLVVGWGNPVAADYAAYACRTGTRHVTVAGDASLRGCVAAPAQFRSAATLIGASGAKNVEEMEIGAFVVFLPPRLAQRDRVAFDALLATIGGCRARVVLVSTFRVHLDDAQAVEIEKGARNTLKAHGVEAITIIRPGHVLSPNSPATRWLRRRGACYPLVPGYLRGCCVDGEEMFATIDRERGPAPSPPYSGERAGVRGRAKRAVAAHNSKDSFGETAPNTVSRVRPLTPALSPEYRGEGAKPPIPSYTAAHPRTLTLLGSNRSWRELLAQHRSTGILSTCITGVCALLSLFLLGYVAGAVLALLSRRRATLRQWNLGTLRPRSFRELLSLYNTYNYRYVKVVGYGNGMTHFGQRFPGRTVVSTVRLNRVRRAGPERLKADCGATVRKALDFLAGSGQDLCVIPNFSYVSLGTAFFVPIHGSAGDYSCVAETITKVILYDPVADRIIAAKRDAPEFRDRVYDMRSDVLLLRLYFCVKPKSRFFIHRQVLDSPGGTELLAALQDPRAKNVEVRKSNAAGATAQLLKYYGDPGETRSPVLELPRDRLGRLWDQLEENAITSFLMHALTRHMAFHVELFFTPQEFEMFWAGHRQLPLRKIQLRFIRRDGFRHSAFREQDCVSSDMFMLRRHRPAFEAYMRRTFPVVRANPGKHSM